jgi:hypothetical protein
VATPVRRIVDSSPSILLDTGSISWQRIDNICQHPKMESKEVSQWKP